MKIHNVRIQFGLCLAACLPLPSNAGIEVPYWLDPEWVAAKVMNFHSRNSERMALEQAQATAKAQTQTQTQTKNNANSTVNYDPNPRRSSLAPVETALPKMNEKYLSKDELAELRKQLRQKQ